MIVTLLVAKKFFVSATQVILMPGAGMEHVAEDGIR
jgi:hypothetical protein